jgi:hypothetical protein
MKDYNIYNSSIDTIILTQNVHEQTYRKARNYKSVSIDPYICKRSGSTYKKALGLEFRHKDHDLNFMQIEIKELPHRVSDYLKITIHLNHFLHQAYPNENHVNSEKIIDDLESIISRYLRFPGFRLDAMNVSRIDIALDFLVKKDPSHYLNIIKHKAIPRYLLHHNNGNSTLSIHSYSLTESINSNEDTPNKGTIYNKSGKLGIEKNLLRFEFKLKGNQKNQLPLDTYNEQGYYDILSDEKGVTKFSHIFCADIGVELKRRFIDGVILKNSEEYEAIVSHDDYINNHRDWVDRFSGADEYYRRLAPLLKERDDINKSIKEIINGWAAEKIKEDQDRETLHELWDLIESNLKEKFNYQLGELDTPVSQTLLQLKNLLLEMGMVKLLVKMEKIIPPKRKKGVDQADLSTLNVMLNYFRKRANEYLSDEKKEAKKDITNRINSLRNEYKTYKKYMFILYLNYTYEGTIGHELYDELKSLANSYNFTPSENVFNLYKYYAEQSEAIEAA